MILHSFTVEPSLVASRLYLDHYQSNLISKAKSEGRLIRVEVGQFMTETFLWGIELI